MTRLFARRGTATTKRHPNPHDMESSNPILEERKITAEITSRMEELALRREELELRKRESERASRFQFSPLSLAVIAGSLSLFTGAITSYSTGSWSLQAQKAKNESELLLQRQKNDSDSLLKEREHQFEIILKAAENRSVEEQKKNLLFFVDIGFLSDDDGKIRRSVEAGKVPFAPRPGLSTYGVARGKVLSSSIMRSVRITHFRVKVRAGEKTLAVSINVQSVDGKPNRLPSSVHKKNANQRLHSS
jgi:hypothetical protein